MTTPPRSSKPSARPSSPLTCFCEEDLRSTKQPANSLMPIPETPAPRWRWVSRTINVCSCRLNRIATSKTPRNDMWFLRGGHPSFFLPSLRGCRWGVFPPPVIQSHPNANLLTPVRQPRQRRTQILQPAPDEQAHLAHAGVSPRPPHTQTELGHRRVPGVHRQTGVSGPQTPPPADPAHAGQRLFHRHRQALAV